MTKGEMVTDFKLEHDDKTPVSFSEIIKAINLHCNEQLDGERFCDRSAWLGENGILPERWRGLIAFCLEGGSEGHYVHVGVMVDFGGNGKPGEYLDMGFAKMWTPESAHKLTIEAQRFLEAARWN